MCLLIGNMCSPVRVITALSKKPAKLQKEMQISKAYLQKIKNSPITHYSGVTLTTRDDKEFYSARRARCRLEHPIKPTGLRGPREAPASPAQGRDKVSGITY